MENHHNLLLYVLVDLLDSSDEDEAHEPLLWVRTTVNVDEYRFMADPAFRLHFRMSSATFEVLLQVVRNELGDDDEDVYHRDPAYNISHVLLMVLWLLATPDTFRSVSLRFGKTPGVLHYHYKRVISCLCGMSARYIKWPSIRERAVIKNAVQRRTGFPGVVGAVDGCHIQIATPSQEPRAYFNRHHDHSVVLQAVCDETLLFRDIYVGEAGSTHDSRVFRRSPLCREILENAQNHFANDEHILGDGAYILTDRVLTPYRNHGNLNAGQQNYNRRLASSRVVVEQAFGRLKMKWRRLIHLSAKNMILVLKTITASVVLHNFLLLDGNEPPPNEFPDHEPIELMVDDGVALDFDHPNLRIERDHPLLAGARELGIAKRLDITALLPLMQ